MKSKLLSHILWIALLCSQFSILAQVPIEEEITPTPYLYPNPDIKNQQLNQSFPIDIRRLSINQVPMPTVWDKDSLPNFYLCEDSFLDIDYIGLASRWEIVLQTVDNEGYTTGCNHCLNFVQSFFGSPGQILLDCLANPTTCDIFDLAVNSGYLDFQIVVTIWDLDDNPESLKSYFSLSAAPTVQNTSVQFNDSFGSVCMEGDVFDTACPIGIYSGSFSAKNNSGSIDFFNVKITEINCVSGEEGQTLIETSQPTIVPSNINMLTSVGLNGLFPQASFVDSSFLGKCIQVKVELGNFCGSVTQILYGKFSGFYLTDNPPIDAFINTDVSHTIEQSVSIYPNPSNHTLTVTFNNDYHGQIHLFNQVGQLVLSVPLNGYSNSIDVTTIPKGCYFLRNNDQSGLQIGGIKKVIIQH